MPAGPNLTIPSAGDALNATDMANNFTAIRDFLSAIPIDNLALYRCPNQFGGQTMATGPADTQTHYGQYFQPVQSDSDSTDGKYIEVSFEADGQIALTDSITITLQEEDSVGSNTYSDVSGASITIDNTTTTRTWDGTGVHYHEKDSFSASLDPTLTYRFKWVNETSATPRVLTSCQASVWGRTKLQGA